VPATADGQSILNLNPTEAPAVLDQFR
jgi:hypothetical protein